ncbi:hypothetical protein P4233_30945 [Pseudomonas aeruginosa]|nr:hypothetical protein [Pseudomonas aeruginosa]
MTLTGTKGLWPAPGQALRHNASGAGLVTTASVTLGDGPTAVSVVALEFWRGRQRPAGRGHPDQPATGRRQRRPPGDTRRAGSMPRPTPSC